jgi:hypothetical protein
MEMTETRTDSADLTFERFKAALGGDGSYPNNAIFVDAEAPFAGQALVRNARDGQTTVLVYPDGEERIYGPITPAGTRSIIARARGVRGKLLSLLSF